MYQPTFPRFSDCCMRFSLSFRRAATKFDWWLTVRGGKLSDWPYQSAKNQCLAFIKAPFAPAGFAPANPHDSAGDPQNGLLFVQIMGKTGHTRLLRGKSTQSAASLKEARFPSRNVAALPAALIRFPIQRITGAAMLLPRAL